MGTNAKKPTEIENAAAALATALQEAATAACRADYPDLCRIVLLATEADRAMRLPHMLKRRFGEEI